MVTDPVCFKQLKEQEARLKARFRGQTYYFHDERCREVFGTNPEEYAAHIPQMVYGDQGKRR